MRLFNTFAVFAVCLLAFARPADDAVAAHQRADNIQIPRFVAAFNTFLSEHGGTPNHVQKLDRKDLERWQDTRAAWRDLDDAFKRAGY